MNCSPPPNMSSQTRGLSNETYQHHCYGGSSHPYSCDHLCSISASGSARTGFFGVRYCPAKSGAVTAAPQLYSCPAPGGNTVQAPTTPAPPATTGSPSTGRLLRAGNGTRFPILNPEKINGYRTETS
jgi:hypothetical protein